MFDIRPDPTCPLLHARLNGFWDVEMVDRYGAALGEAIGRCVASRGRFGLLVDARVYPTQSAAVVARFTAMLSQWPLPSRDGPLAGVAIVAGDMLGKIQARRTFGDVVTVFLDKVSATQWLEQQI